MTRLSAASLATLLISLAAPAPAAPPVEFNRDVRPILADRCFPCHGPDAGHRKAGLRLDTAEGARSVLAPGKPADSELYLRISRQKGAGKMPPKKSGKDLSAAEVALLGRWIEEGARYEKHWSYAPLRRPAVPAVKDAAWPRNPIDRFVLVRIEAAGARPSPEAGRAALARRLYLDLTGLPPTFEEVDAFVHDARPDAYGRLVDRLMASPHHAERLATYWLDLVRYADTVGYHGDQEHHVWPYRDWVLAALAENMPFDRFTAEQLAGDLLPGATEQQKVASGYNRVLQTTHEGGAQDGEYLAKYAADRVRNLSSVWLGATLGCAECHDHKFDPYTQKDFYRLAAFFADVLEHGAFKGPDRTPTRRPPELAVLPRLDRLEADELGARIARLEAECKSRKEGVEQELDKLKSRRRALERRRALTMITVSVKPRPVRVLARGDWMDPSGEIVEPGVPASLGALPVKGRRATRLDLARWLTSPEQPQTARVFVNRLWYLFFGAGLSRNLEDTGSQGEWPTHPELLDWLAVEFVESGWDVRHVVRLMVGSAAYRQSSQEPEALVRLDPENRLFARQARVRLSAEAIRDQALAVSGLLVRRFGGPSARPYQPDGYYQYLNFPTRTYRPDKGPEQYRRGVYTHWQRQFLQPMLKAFDAPSREECTARRPVSNTPLQALALLNDPSFVEAARVLAARALREGGDTEAGRLGWAWREVLSRPITPREEAVLLRLLRQQLAHYREDRAEAEKLLRVGQAPAPAGLDAAELAAWTAVARALLNLDEAITRN
jgi:hypothetical protein